MMITIPDPKNEDNIVDICSIINKENDLIPIKKEVDEDTGKALIKGYIITRRGILKLIDAFKLNIKFAPQLIILHT